MRLRATKSSGISSSGTGYCPRMNAVIAYARANGISLPPKSELKATNTFLRDTKSTLDKLDVKYLLDGSGSVAFKMINVVNPNKYYGISYGGLSYSSNGVTGNGSNGYISTEFNPSLLVAGQKYQLGNSTVGCFVASSNAPSIGSTDVLIGSQYWRGTTLVNSTQLWQRGCGISNDISTSYPSTRSINMSGIGLKALIYRNTTTILTGINKNIETSVIEPNVIILESSTLSILNRQMFFGVASIASMFCGQAINYDESQILKNNLNKRRASIGLTVID